jgi:nickel/cobalt transporter (NiCoT) family protein
MAAVTVDISGWNRFRTALTSREWATIASMVGFILLLNVIGWVVLAVFIAPYHYNMGASGVYGIGLGFTAYALGMRHAFDADHIAAIDNTTRKLMTDGQRPLSVGFWFSLGHSSIVFLLSLLLSLGVRALAGQVESESSTLHTATGVIGTSVSGVFLYLIGIVNLVVLLGIIKVFQQMRRGSFDEAELEKQLNSRGFMNRFLNRATKAVRKSWHMYPLGLLFGLGFDTATEVGLLVLAAGAAAFALPWYAILVLPILFAAGMSMFDAADGCFMNFAYGWAFATPVRKVFYNITITGLSVAVALIIGTIELVSILTDKLGIESGPLAWVAHLDLNNVGFFIVGLFVVTWLAALVVWRFAHIEARWTERLAPSSEASSQPAIAQQDSRR